ncbi:MAG: type I 3-dehydroquinate dehydratase [Burkholderiales bacterium]|jgi:3-dehydroquinate dehydratase-1|nr:type I 3-dehydroquinate dehydratase [Burkholderiales bacterium]
MEREKRFEVRGRLMGGETPLVCTPLVGRTREAVLAEAANVVAKKPDVVEWRVDFFAAIADTQAVVDTGRALRAAVGETPVIFTRRSVNEGGTPIPLDDAGVVALYDAVGAAGLVDFLDFEMGNDPAQVRSVVATARAQRTRVILSYHNFGYTPGQDFLVGRFLEAERLGADVAKVAVMPRDRMDVLTLLSATATAHAKGGIPLISMSMGPLGAVTRMVGGLFGSSLSFAVGDAASAPGQMPIADLAAVYGVIARARGAK